MLNFKTSSVQTFEPIISIYKKGDLVLSSTWKYINVSTIVLYIMSPEFHTLLSILMQVNYDHK